MAKGIEIGTLLRPTQIITDTLEKAGAPVGPIGAISGPTIAEELARCLPATVIAASEDQAFAEALQQTFTCNWFRVYTLTDLLGVELAGATKNVIALAAGILDGLAAGNNAKSALLARGLAEILRLGTAMGAQHDTFFGIAGVGDLATTCFSPTGRNRSCGEKLGQGQTRQQIIDQSHDVVEGIPTTQAVMQLAAQYHVEMPITAAIYSVLFENLDPITAISQLMNRQLKPEQV
jgi:glycerol-3-phosphate dehydrogenase (NAD(P)+)